MNQEFTIDPSRIELQDAHMASEDIIQALHKNGEFFINFFLSEELEYDVPAFHKECWQFITAEMIMYIALALPRGTAKTTLSKLCCVWYLLFTDIRFIVYVSNTAPIAAEAVKDIMAYMRSENFIKIFGAPEFMLEREGHGYYHFKLNCPDGRGGFYKKFCILKALGAGQQVRGLNVNNERPQLAIVDDLEDNENTATSLMQQKLKKWFFGAFIKALSKKRKKIIYLGNMLSNQSILYYLCEQSTQWHSIRKGILLSSGESLWPEMWSKEEIQADFVEYQKMGQSALWFAEMMNMPMVEGIALIAPDEITYLPPVVPGEQKTAFITYDPAVSTKTWANDSALAVHAWVRDRWQIVEIVKGKYEPEKIFHLIVELSIRWNTRAVGIENGAYELGLRPLFEILMKAFGYSFQIYSLRHKNRSKTERLSAWCGALKTKHWVLTEGDHVITQQLITYDPLKTNNIDDVIDACSMGFMMTELHMTEIMNQYDYTGSSYEITTVLGH